MANIWEEFLANRLLVAALSAWLIAQVGKAVLYTIIHKKWSFERLFGSGGMPSSHAATVCALALAAFIYYGVGSFEFAVTAILAAVVLHDARGVRLQTGRQAAILNHILQNLVEGESNPFADIKLDELIGHTPLQVFIGSLIGIGTAIVVC
jgi:acid phosphatase family membrane protein YuiD